MDHGGQFGMEGSVMSQGVDLCDNLAVATVNLNELAQTQSHIASENENGRQQGSTTKPPFNNNGNYEQDKQEKALYTGQPEEDQDELMREEEDDSEESSLIRCQSPDTPMTDSSYSETGSLLETPYPFSPGTSPEPISTVSPIVGSEKQSCISIAALDSGCGDAEMKFINSTTKAAKSSSEQYTSSPENVLTYKLTGPNAIAVETSPQHSFVSFEGTEHLSHCSRSFTADRETPDFAGLETSNDHSSPLPACTTEITVNQEPAQLLGFLDQLAKRGDDTHLPQYLHQIAEAFVSQEDYQRAICCIQLERLYHQRLLDNLGALQKQWETRCNTTSPNLAAQHLDTLKHICLTHSRPKASDAVCASLDHLVVPSCSSDFQIKERMEQKAEDSSGSHFLSPSIDPCDKIDSSEVTETDWEDSKSERSDSFHQAQSNEKEGNECKGDETEGGLACTMLAEGNGVPPSVTEDMDQSKTAEQQGGALCPAQEKETDREEEKDVEEATEALEMEDEEEGEEEGHNEKAFSFCPEALPVETIVSAAEVEIQLQESRTEQKETQLSQEDIQDSDKTCLPSETCVPENDDMKLPDLVDIGKEEEEEEEEEYEVEQADLIRAAASLDDLAKLITVEEMAPAPSLVSILKKRSVCTGNDRLKASPECNTLPAKRRVRFKVPDDGFENDMGGGDSCLLLFLLCLVTVVISIGGTALYCALGDTHSSVCQDFSRNADFYIGQIQRGIAQIQHWFTAAL